MLSRSSGDRRGELRDVITALVEAGLDANVRDDSFSTPLHDAVGEAGLDLGAVQRSWNSAPIRYSGFSARSSVAVERSGRSQFWMQWIETMHHKMSPIRRIMRVFRSVFIRSSLAKRLISGSLLTCFLIATALPLDQDHVRARTSSHTIGIAGAGSQMTSIARQPNRVRSLASHWRGSEALLTSAPSALLLVCWGSTAVVASLYLRFLSGLLLLGRSPPPALL
jgi:hypothetical protein